MHIQTSMTRPEPILPLALCQRSKEKQRDVASPGLHDLAMTEPGG